MQTTSHILMIRPVRFGYNAETAVNNAFQQKNADDAVHEKAVEEFDRFVQTLRENGIDVNVVNDTAEPHTPDSIFPNNWVSFHSDGSLLLYPMFAENRRAERKEHVLQSIAQKFTVDQTIDLSYFEKKNEFLEGTGSMVLDRDNRIAYACISPRTSAEVLKEFCKKMNYLAVLFHAADANGRAIYHTNVLMCVGEQFVVICLEAISDEDEKTLIKKTITNSGKKLIEISLMQMEHFAGNMLQVQNRSGEKILVMSTRAYESLNADQIKILSAYNRIVHSSLNTIEKNGGGSARCMMAEVYLPPKK